MIFFNFVLQSGWIGFLGSVSSIKSLKYANAVQVMFGSVRN